MWNGLAPHPRVVGKNSGGIYWEQGVPAQVPSARKIMPHNFWLQKPAGIESVEEDAGTLSSFSWRNQHMDSPTDTCSL